MSLAGLCRSWPCEVWPFRHPQAYLGKDGGGGIGSGPGISVGAALALHTRGKQTVAVLGDGDFCMGASAIWSAVRSRIPLLVLINNNRSYFNDELHQETVARRRNRPVGNRWIGQRLADPEIDIAKLAEAQGAVGIGPMKKAADLEAAIAKGVGVLQVGRRLCDRRARRSGRGTQRDYDRHAQHLMRQDETDAGYVCARRPPREAPLQRLTISLDDNMAAAIDAFMAERGYGNRSEAIRDLVRDGLVRSAGDGPASRQCVAAVSYVYDYDGRDLALRLDRAQHEHHDLTIATTRTRLDHRHCMEVTLLRGQTPSRSQSWRGHDRRARRAFRADQSGADPHRRDPAPARRRGPYARARVTDIVARCPGSFGALVSLYRVSPSSSCRRGGSIMHRAEPAGRARSASGSPCGARGRFGALSGEPGLAAGLGGALPRSGMLSGAV